MKIAPYLDDPLALATGMLVLPCCEGALDAGWAFPLVDDALGGLLRRLVEEEKFKGKEQETLLLHTQQRLAAARVLLVGLGRDAQPQHDRMRLAAAVAVRQAQAASQGGLAFVVPELPGAELPRAVRQVVEGVLLGGYRFEKYRKERKDDQLAELKLVLSPRSARGGGETLVRSLERGELLGRAVLFCRDLVNEPADRLKPVDLAQAARTLAKEAGLKARVLGARELAKQGMGCLLGVAAGSDAEPQLIHLTYHPGGTPAKSVALVGKGVTFDAGGLDLKTAKGMEEMKADMAGAATVLAAIKAVAALRPAVVVHAIVPATENMPSGRALHPGDILTALDGTTVEVRNTDAEGRLILADAIAYAVRLGVDEIVEASTLTGACVVALGPYHAGAMTDDEELAARFLDAARRSGERYWRLPLVPELRKEVEGEISDLKNSGAGRDGGAIQGGLFLAAFAGEKPFIHLDIAGPAMAEKETPLSRKGGTGFGVLSLVEYLAGS